ncbi:MAG TPA: hypothetical protein VLZ75_08905 [Chitinophagales bacterium]|nr:hypothetical protein [Chitinophagales bacterium]
MKNIFLFVLSFSVYAMSYAQTNSLYPQWKKGDFKKVTYKDIIPNIEEGIALDNDTSITTFIWEVMDVQDTTVILSIIPLNIEIKTKNKELIKESQFLIDIFQLLREKALSIPYISRRNGVLFTPKNSADLMEDYNARYIQQTDLINAVKNISFSESIQQYIDQNQVNKDSLSRYLLLTYIDGMISTIHSPFGKDFTYNQAVSVAEMNAADWEVFMPSLDFEKSRRLFTGQFEFLKLKESIECPFRFQTSYISADSNKETTSKKKKKKRKPSKNDFVFKITYSGNYIFSAKNFIPLKYFLSNSTELKKGGNTLSKTPQQIITFE